MQLKCILNFGKYIYPHPKTLFTAFRKRGNRRRERIIDQLSPACAMTGDQTHSLGGCPEWESSPQSFGVGTMLQSTKPLGQGYGIPISGTCLKLTCFQNSHAILWSIVTWGACSLSAKDHCWDPHFLIDDLSPNWAVMFLHILTVGSRLKGPDSHSPFPLGLSHLALVFALKNWHAQLLPPASMHH